MTDRPVIFSVFEGQMGLDWTLWEELMGGLHICRSVLREGAWLRESGSMSGSEEYC